MVWIQGSIDFLDVLREGLELPRTVSVLVPGSTANKRYDWDKLGLQFRIVSHAQVGGLTSNKWLLAFPTKWNTCQWELNSSVKRFVQDVLDPTERGKVVPAPEGKREALGLVRDLTTRQVIASSVFSSTGFVSRRLTHKEIGMVVDLPSQVITRLGSRVVDCIGAVPSKVVAKLGELFLLQQQPNVIEADPSVESERPRQAKFIKDDCAMDDHDAFLLSMQKAVKADSALPPYVLWYERLFRTWPLNDGTLHYTPHLHDRMFGILQERFLMFVYVRRLYRGFRAYMCNTYGDDWCSSLHRARYIRSVGKPLRNSKIAHELLLDAEVGHAAISKAGRSSWWDWTEGSSLFFWRWPKQQRLAARDGLPVYLSKPPPAYWMPQRWNNDTKINDMMREKLHDVIRKGYMGPGHVTSLTSFFAVPKGDHDIRMVYDATISGTNDAIWTPTFMLPSLDMVLRSVHVYTYFGDNDQGEMFLNYPLDRQARQLFGVDVTHLEPTTSQQNKKSRVYYRWCVNCMGAKPSPYNSVRMFTLGEEVIKGDRRDKSNIFAWDEVVLNLPGLRSYDPSLPWVFKFRRDVGKIANEFIVYVDDVRCIGQSKLECERVARTVAARAQYLGQQDAARKRRVVSQRPGAWAGSIVGIDDDHRIFVTVSHDKWTKAKGILQGWLSHLKDSDTTPIQFDHKEMERGRGFLVHFVRTFNELNPYLKGIHLTLDGWRPDRDENGWKYSKRQWDQLVDRDDPSASASHTATALKRKAPAKVAPVTRFQSDVEAMLSLLDAPAPVKRIIRGTKHVLTVCYGFGDASGSGFGSSFTSADGTIRYRYGRWGSDMDDSSSNYRELLNLVMALEALADEGSIDGTEMFLFTDNSTAESAYYKGTSSSPILFELVLRIKRLVLGTGSTIHLIHVAGTRMIAQGTDGLSRGNLNEGVMAGMTMGAFVPLAVGSLEVSSTLSDWLTSWWGESLRLTPDGWFERGHDLTGIGVKNEDGIWIPQTKEGSYIWAPPPAAALVAVEQLRLARLKRQDSSHLFVCPRLMTYDWRSHLNKTADIVFEVPPSYSFWPSSAHEPLIIGIVLPYLRFKPWQLGCSPAFLEVEGILRSMRKDEGSFNGDFLRKFREWAGQLTTLPQGMVWQMLRSFRDGKISRCPTGE